MLRVPGGIDRFIANQRVFSLVRILSARRVAHIRMSVMVNECSTCLRIQDKGQRLGWKWTVGMEAQSRLRLIQIGFKDGHMQLTIKVELRSC